MTPTKLAVVSAMTLGLAAGGAFAQATDPATGTTGADATGTMSGDAMAGGSMMGSYDTDSSGSISQEEFGTGLASQGTFQGLDSDADGMLSREEFEAGMPGQVGMFEELDSAGTGMISEEDFSSGLFGQYDTEGTGELDETQFSEFESGMSGGMGMDGMGSGADAAVPTTEGDPSLETDVETETGTEGTDG